MTRKRRRLWVLGACALGVGSATALSLSAFSTDMVYYLSPSQIAQKHVASGRVFRMGGLVEAGSVKHAVVDGRPTATFRVTDLKGDVAVSYVGILPDLFREGQGVVTLGRLTPDGRFAASEVLAKHDETYMPKDVADALKASGKWRPEQGPPPAASTWNMLDPAAVTKPNSGRPPMPSSS